ncbi:MAG: metallophosphoesterase family protein [Chloroflexi bacterium]|nr:metallophosphoesterase family protein [Chloroflexota bacterium]
MQLAILSDIHDHVWNLRIALAGMPAADAILCCGDLCSPFVVNLLAEGAAGRPVHIVFGNNDGDLFRIAQNAARADAVHLHGAFFRAEFDGRSVAMNHYPELALGIAAAGQDDLVCYGHNHLFRIEQLGRALTINPGPVMGYDPTGRRDVAATFVIYDTTAGAAAAYEVRLDDGRIVPYQWT